MALTAVKRFDKIGEAHIPGDANKQIEIRARCAIGKERRGRLEVDLKQMCGSIYTAHKFALI